jgi:prepilin-type N-terminal cleavage/methylation domain-containing protein
MQIKTNRKSGFILVEIMISVAIIGLLAAIAIPNFVKAREQAQLNSVVNNLRITEGAKDQWALENKQGTGAVPVPTDVAPYMKNNKSPPTRSWANPTTAMRWALRPRQALRSNWVLTLIRNHYLAVINTDSNFSQPKRAAWAFCF